jgi:hypothetical protein
MPFQPVVTPPLSDAFRLAASLLPLENGENLHSPAFLRRYESMPDVKKVELVEGTVFLPSPVRADLHGEPNGLMQIWMVTYAYKDGQCAFYPGTTLLLDVENVVEPDAILCSPPRKGGRVWLNAKGYLCGAPELICEVAASTSAIDLHQKFRAYCRNGVAEYLVWLTVERRFLWFVLEDGEFVEMKPDADGKLSSRIFPGLVLDTQAALAGRAVDVMAALLAPDAVDAGNLPDQAATD